MNRTRSLLVLLLLSVLSAPLFPQNSLEDRLESTKKTIAANPPPTGYSWQLVKELNAAFLKPDGWFVAQKVQNAFLIVAISQEDPAITGRFQHGLTIFASRYDGPGQGLLGYLQDARDKLASKYRMISKNDLDFGPMKGYNALYIMREENIGIFTLFIGNPTTKAFYQLAFETPIKDFDAYWAKYGNDMIENLLLDDET